MAARLGLFGGEEFADGFQEVHAGLLTELGPANRRVVFLPTCAAEDGDEAIDHWCTIARDKLSALGAQVETPRVVDADPASDPRHAQLVAEADWIYLGGGYPHVARRVLLGSRVLEALQAARERGVLITGSSGGAMLMCAVSHVMTPELAAEVQRVWPTGAPPGWDPPVGNPIDCLGLIPRSMCAPHFDRLFPLKWLERGVLPAGYTLIGIDELTALVSKGDSWEVRGRGAVTLVGDDRKLRRFESGRLLALDDWT